MRTRASTIISPMPIGMASVRQVIETSSVGVMTTCSSSTCSIDAGRIIARNARLAASAIAANCRCAAGDSLFTSVVMRRFSVAAERERAAEHRKPEEQDRGELVRPDQRPVEHVARQNADEQDHDLGDDQRGGACFQKHADGAIEPRRATPKEARVIHRARSRLSSTNAASSRL